MVGVEGTKVGVAWVRLEKYAGTRPPPDLPGLGEGMALILRVSGKYHASINPPLKLWFSACTAPSGSFWNFVETLGCHRD